MNKTYRQGQILRLIKVRRIHTQDQLAQELESLGLEATQVTLSRDIRELGLVKTPDGYTRPGEAAGAARAEPNPIPFATLIDVRSAQNLLVLRTRPGHANALAVALDQADWKEIVGTVAGDDTVLVVTPDNQTAAALRKRMMEHLR